MVTISDREGSAWSALEPEGGPSAIVASPWQIVAEPQAKTHVEKRRERKKKQVRFADTSDEDRTASEGNATTGSPDMIIILKGLVLES